MISVSLSGVNLSGGYFGWAGAQGYQQTYFCSSQRSWVVTNAEEPIAAATNYSITSGFAVYSPLKKRVYCFGMLSFAQMISSLQLINSFHAN